MSKLKTKIERCMLDHLSLDQYNENAIVNNNNNNNVHSDIFALKSRAASTLFSNLTPSQSPTSIATSKQLLKSTVLIDAHKNVSKQHQQQQTGSGLTAKLSSSALNFDQNNNSTSLSNFNYFEPNGSSISERSSICSCHSNSKSPDASGNNELSISTLVHNNSVSLQEQEALLAQSNSSATDIVIDVYLLAECCYNELVAQSGDNLIDLSAFKSTCRIHSEQSGTEKTAVQPPYSFETLERWNISMITNKR